MVRLEAADTGRGGVLSDNTLVTSNGSGNLVLRASFFDRDPRVPVHGTDDCLRRPGREFPGGIPSGKGRYRRPAPGYGRRPPAIAPTTSRGSVPAATASGSGLSGESCERSSLRAKNRTKGRRCPVTWSRMVPPSAG